MKATAKAPSNIAFIKYWGKNDEALRIPSNPSISMNVSHAYTVTTVEFSPEYLRDTIEMIDFIRSERPYKLQRPPEFVGFRDPEVTRIQEHLDRIRKRANISDRARVVTKNSFPKGTGIASSASGFAALTVAACIAAGLELHQKELTLLARLGSGTACRSIPDGFVRWETADTSDDSFAHSLFPHTWWDLRDILCIVQTKEKSTPSSAGMNNAATSPLWKKRQQDLPNRTERVTNALKEKNIRDMGEAIEEDCFSMHDVMRSQLPPLEYFTGVTKRVIDEVRAMRGAGLPVYVTIDAGPNIHCICEGNIEKEVSDRVKRIPGVQSVMINMPAEGTKIIQTHLF